ncbi:DUF3293 domain-containing protein [Glaciimonas sp. CA11.2]|uniref:DUF3293 domain-containing protein n=1 Tax=Glaciimonas sp. CA11.2 TaxID=3048601 RepID=UPI002AB53C43|nr:DUF3293 domain-containing protein [Glaciimonas sp. CA11.2]MDY7549182.1 DUF3293 domain-containing protein [Glaciimonas sp. CA11.2]MEB0161503.1 DUF3293 domain-containing protein [Glaciimonas sp. CA11.2]
MISASNIDPQIIQAYLETHYCVDGPPSFVIQIGVVNDALKKLYRQSKFDCCAFMTACNPFSQNLGDAVNANRQAVLAHDLNKRSLTYLHGTGRHPTGNWPGEPSYFVLGLSRESARVLGQQYEQNAIVWCGADAVPQLIVLR